MNMFHHPVYQGSSFLFSVVFRTAYPEKAAPLVFTDPEFSGYGESTGFDARLINRQPEISPAVLRRYAGAIQAGCESGDPDAMLCLARMTEDQDPVRAGELYRSLAELEPVRTAYYLGRFLWVFGNQDPEAEVWLLQASVYGCAEADFLLGIWYESVRRKPVLARAYYEASAFGGHKKAMLHLGLLLLDQGSAGSGGEGEMWLVRAHEAGNCLATAALVRFYRMKNQPEKARAMMVAFEGHPEKGCADWLRIAPLIRRPASVRRKKDSPASRTPERSSGQG